MSVSNIAELITARYALQIADEETGLDKDGKRPPSVKNKQVRNELEGALGDYKESRADEIHAKRLETIRQYEELGMYAFEEYEKSRADRIIKTSIETDNPEHGTTTTEKEVIEARVVGDKGFLFIVRDCKDRIAELEAVVPPRKTTLTNPDGTEPFKFEGAEEFKRLAALAEELLNPHRGADTLPERKL